MGEFRRGRPYGALEKENGVKGGSRRRARGAALALVLGLGLGLVLELAAGPAAGVDGAAPAAVTGAAAVAGAVPPAPTPDPAAPGELRVMTFNIRYGTALDGENAWEKRRELLGETIRALRPDVLGTQECLAGQAEFLRTALPGYGCVGVGRDDGKLAGEMCAIFYREDRFRLLAEGHFWLSETPEVVGSRGWDAALPRLVSWVRLRARDDTMRTLVCFDTHFDHVGEAARLASAQLLRERAQAVAGGAPAIVLGDFNAPADAGRPGPYAALLGRAQEAQEVGEAEEAEERLALRDVYRQLHAPQPDEGTFHGFTGRRDGERIDWILATPDWVPLAAAIDRTGRDGRWPSDHFPVTAVLRWPAALTTTPRPRPRRRGCAA